MNHGTDLQSQAYMDLINSLSPIKFTDSSYGNDVCDSIMNEEKRIQIFLPNMENPFDTKDDFGETHHKFGLTIIDYGGTAESYVNHEFELPELVYFLRTLSTRFVVVGNAPWTLYDAVIARPDQWRFLSELLKLKLGDEFIDDCNQKIHRLEPQVYDCVTMVDEKGNLGNIRILDLTGRDEVERVILDTGGNADNAYQYSSVNYFYKGMQFYENNRRYYMVLHNTEPQFSELEWMMDFIDNLGEL